MEEKSNVLVSRIVLYYLPVSAVSLIVLLTLYPTQYTNFYTLLLITVWLTLWWASQVVPLAVTSLLSLILLPTTGVITVQEAFSSFSHPVIFLFFGGFCFALALQSTGLHRRMALSVILFMGRSLRMLVLGIMFSTALLSMFMSNTVTAIMMYPLGMGICSIVTENYKDLSQAMIERIRSVIMLAIAYAASLGGIATIIGSPPNAIAVGIMQSIFSFEISFLDWAMVGVPISLLLTCITWLYLLYTNNIPRIGVESMRQYLIERRAELGPISNAEKVVLGIGMLMLCGWVGNDFGVIPLLHMFSDTQIALIAVVLLFMVKVEGKPLLNNDVFANIEWNILFMFGAGFALSSAYSTLPLDDIISPSLHVLAVVHPLFVVILCCSMAAFLTEFTSNSSVATLLLPLTASIAIGLDLDPIFVMLGVCFSVSCAFMLPSSTPSNAIVYSSGFVSIRTMFFSGIVLTVLVSVIIGLYVYCVLQKFIYI